MRIELKSREARVIGALLEKEITTPDQYPLSLNALTSACNQKSSREPIMQMSETEVQQLLDELVKKHLASGQSGFGSRVPKYKHRFCNTGFGGFEFSPQETGLLCVLLLRGPQTPGELRTRTQRLCQFTDVEETERVLQGLSQRDDGPFVVRLPREPGKRESRYRHLFGVEEEMTEADAPLLEPTPAGDLQLVVNEMRAELEDLKARVAKLEAKE